MSKELDSLGQLSSQNPWPGLRAFTESDRDFFWGRKRETAELLGLVQRAPVTVLYGQSGLGKTSLLQAGIFPDLKRLNFLPFRLRFDHGDDAPPLAAQIKAALSQELDAAQVTAPRPGAEETLWEYFHRRDVDFWGPRNRLLVPVIVLDQFEEVFTLGQKNEATAGRVAQFAAELEALLEHRPPEAVREHLESHPDDGVRYDFQRQVVKFIFSLREDFLPHLDTWRTRMPSLLPHRFRLERMTGGQALEVVGGAGGNLVDADVARDIVDFVSSSQRRRGARLTEQREVEPALLSVVCDELNRRRIDRGQASITADLLTHEREGIIQSFYDRAFEDIDPRVRNWVEDELLTASGYRDRAAMEDALKLGFPEDAFDRLVDRRILHREEREGVLWLELTHDLLTDPAARSRTLREQRLQTETAIQLRHQLRHAKQRNVLYVAMLLISVVGFTLAYLAQRRATRAAAESATNLQMAAETTRSMGLDVSGDLWVPTATVVQTIEKVENAYANLAGHVHDSDEIKLRHAQFLAKAAIAQYNVGHFKEGIADASKGEELLNDVKHPALLPDFPLARAESFYAHGKGLVETGQLNEARGDLEKALALTEVAQNASGHVTEAARIRISAKISLGDVEKRALAFDAAARDYEQALQIIDEEKSRKTESDSKAPGERDRQARGFDEDEVRYWKALALSGIGLSQTQDEKAEYWLGQAVQTIGGLSAIRHDDLREKRLFAEIAYQDGFAEYRLDKNDESENLMRQAAAASEDLVQRDPDNLDWQLSQAQAQRGAGMLHVSRGEWELAQQLLEKAEKTSGELVSNQPNWTQAQFLQGATLFSLADLIQRKYYDYPSEWRDTKDLQRALDGFTQARKLLQSSAQLSPKSLELLSWAIAYQGYIYNSQAFLSGTTTEEADQKWSRALGLYAEARQVLRPIEQQQQGDVATYAEWTAGALLNRKKVGAAISSYQEALKVRAATAQKTPTPRNYSNLSRTYELLGGAHLQNKDASAATTAYNRAAQAIETALKLRAAACGRSGCPFAEQDVDLARQKADVQASISDMRNGQSDLAGSLDAIEQAITTVWNALQQGYANEALTGDLDRYRRFLDNKRKVLEAQQTPGKAQAAKGNEQTASLLRRVKSLQGKSDPTKLLRRNDQASWAQAPMFPGAWRILSFGELESARKQLLGADKRFTAEEIRGIRKLPVDFYDDAAIYEAEVTLDEGKTGILAFVRRGREITVLSGWPDRIHEMNKKSPPRLDTTERAMNYLRFFESAIQGDQGRLMMVDQLQDIRWLPDAKQEQRDEAAKSIRPLIVEALPDGRWEGIGTVQVSTFLVLASFELSRVGYVNLRQLDAVGEKLPVSVEGFLQGIRQPFTEEMKVEYCRRSLNANPNHEDCLRSLPDLYGKLHKWNERVEAQRALIAHLNRTLKEDSERKEKLPGEYADLAWDQMVAGDFAGALASTDEGRKLDDSNLTVQQYRGHALLLLGRTQEAHAIYQQLESKPKWDEALLDIVTLTARYKLWDERADAQKKYVAYLEHSLADDKQRHEKLPDEYAKLAWDQLIAGDFNGALEAAEAGLKLDDSSERLQTDRAHALEMLGRTQEAAPLYHELEAKPDWADVLGDLVTICNQTQHWKERAVAQQRLVAYLERTVTDEKERRRRLPDEYMDLSWDQLWIGDFSSALASAETGKKVGGTSPAFDEYRAHALLLLGRTEEADILYRDLEGKPGWKQVLGRRINLATEHKHWKDAADTQIELVKLVQRDAKNDQERHETLPGEYTSLSWYQIFARDFSGALNSCEAGRKWESGTTYLPLETNCAHALMFLGRTAEAEGIYFKYRGQKVFSNPERTWEQVVLKDFDDLRDGGLTHPDMDNIRGQLGAKSSASTAGQDPAK